MLITLLHLAGDNTNATIRYPIRKRQNDGYHKKRFKLKMHHKTLGSFFPDSAARGFTA